MSARLLIIAAFAISLWTVVQTPTATAQGVYGGANPVLVNDPGFGDPYAFAGPPPVAGWLPSFPAGPTLSNRLWVRGEYLYWFADGMETPPLVTTSPAGTPQNQATILGMPNTQVLFGGDEINDDWTDGFRARSGFWLTPQGAFGVEAEYFQLFGHGDSFAASGNGAPIIGRPFFDTTNDRETAQLVSYPGLVNGSVAVGSETELRSALLNARASLCPTFVGVCPPTEESDRVDWIVGYRFLELEDQLRFNESLTSQVVGAPGTITLAEQIRTQNRFNGLQLGVTYEANFRRLWLESMLRVAIGKNSQRVNLSGNTTITELGVAETFPGGLLVQTSNLGSYRREEFTMIPEVGLTLGVRITDCFHATVGYSILYFPNVIRAGDQIDRNVNPNLIPEQNAPVTGSQRPQFSFVETDYWAQGLSVGGEFRF